VTFSATHVYVLLNPQTSPFTLYKFNNSTLVLESVHQIGQVDSLDLQTSFSFKLNIIGDGILVSGLRSFTDLLLVE